jgi:hypothetical protein
MKEITYLVQPIGKKKGAACAVRRIDYENLNWEEFLELRGNFSAGFIMKAVEQRAEPNFNGLDMLSERQKELYGKLGVYFGSKKKPTLQSLAINLLNGETDGKDFSERSLYIYLEAVEEYRKRRKRAAGFDVLHFTFHSVTAFNNERTIREALESMEKAVAGVVAATYKNVSEMGANLLKNITPQLTNNLIKNLLPKYEISNFSEILQSIVTILPNPESLAEKKD